MAITHGMDVEAVERVARRLQDHYAARLEAMSDEIARLVSRSAAEWQGPDAERFRGWWPAKASLLKNAAEDLRGFGRSALNNVAEQLEASGGAAATPSQPRTSTLRAGSEFESRTGFEVDRSIGLIVRHGQIDSFRGSYGSDGSEVRYTAKDYLEVGTGDVFKVLGFAEAMGKGESGPVSFDIGLRANSGTEFIWRQDFGSSDGSIDGTSSIPTQQTTFANWITGYDASEVLADIEQGKLAQPAAVANVSGVTAFAASDIESGGAVFGSSGEVSVERRTEHWVDGTTIDAYSMTGTAGASVGAHLEAGVPSLSGDLRATTGQEVAVEVRTIYDSAGTPVSVEYSVAGHAEVGAEAALNYAGGGATRYHETGVLVERTLSFDLTDPDVAKQIEGASTIDLAASAQWASEEVKVFASSSHGVTSDAIVFEAGAESSTYEMVHTDSRGPSTNPVAGLIDGHDGWHQQTVTESDGSTSTVWVGEF